MTDRLLLATLGANDMWYALPLVLAVSLVYAATRHEHGRPIAVHALRVGVWITGFMGVVFGLIWFVSWLGG